MKHRVMTLIDYHVWANERLFDHLEKLPKEIYHREIQSVFPSISKTVAHMYLFDNLWLAVLAEENYHEITKSIDKWTQEAQDQDLTHVRSLFSAVYERYRALFRRETDPDKPMTIEHPQFGKLETRFSGIVQHVVNHGTYHRGNIAAMLRQQGHEGVSTDYVFYLYES